MDNALALVNETQETKPARRAKIYRECPLTDDVIFQATDECSRSGWFLRVRVSGLYPRRVGPYPTKRAAIDGLEEILAGMIQEPLLEMEADITNTQVYVIEGIPTLNGRCAQKGR